MYLKFVSGDGKEETARTNAKFKIVCEWRTSHSIQLQPERGEGTAFNGRGRNFEEGKCKTVKKQVIKSLYIEWTVKKSSYIIETTYT